MDDRIVAVTEPPWYDGSTCEAYYGGSPPPVEPPPVATALWLSSSRHGMTALHARCIILGQSEKSVGQVCSSLTGIAKRLTVINSPLPRLIEYLEPLVGEWIYDKHERSSDCLIPP